MVSTYLLLETKSSSLSIFFFFNFLFLFVSMVLRSCSQFFKFTLMGVGAIFQIVFRYMIACQYNLKLILCYSKKINYTFFFEKEK